MKKLNKNPKPYALAYSLRDLLDYYPIRPADAFNWSGVHRTTWQSWLNGTSQPPRATIELIYIKSLGALPDLAFDGFRCHSGLIFDETNTGFTPGDIRSIPFFRAGQFKYISAMRQLEALQSKVAGLEMQLSLKNLGLLSDEKKPESLSNQVKLAPNLV